LLNYILKRLKTISLYKHRSKGLISSTGIFMESYRPEDVVKNKEIKVHPSIFNVIREKRDVEEKMLKVKHRIGVYSAKGGVGKTTVSINLAYTLNTMGFKVGLLDADIDCPNVTFFLGIKS